MTFVSQYLRHILCPHSVVQGDPPLECSHLMFDWKQPPIDLPKQRVQAHVEKLSKELNLSLLILQHCALAEPTVCAL